METYKLVLLTILIWETIKYLIKKLFHNKLNNM